jgi:ABC-type uncharacterized transport system permease subunit
MEVYLTVGYDFYPDVPRENELGQRVEDIHVAVHTTMEAAKRAYEDQLVKDQRANEYFADWDLEDLPKITWSERDGKVWWNEYPGPEVVIRKMTVAEE